MALPSGLTIVYPTYSFTYVDPNSITNQELGFSNGNAGGASEDDLYLGANNSSAPFHFTRLPNGKVLFEAADGTDGRELWITDGTAAGTHLVKDINAVAPTASHDAFSSTVSQSAPDRNAPVVLGNYAYFVADDGVHGRELWRSDGTAAGTQMVADINASGSTGSNPYWLTVMNGHVYFTADDGTHGQQIWRTDGTTTEMVTNLVGAPTPDYTPSPFFLVPSGNKLFFAWSDGTYNANSQQLWVTNGTPGNATELTHESGSASPSNMVDIGGTLYFQMADATHGGELWTSDGTVGGTAMLDNIAPDTSGAQGSGPGNFTALNGKVYFVATDNTHGYELWVTDGTAGGTHMVKDINVNGSGGLTDTAIYSNSGMVVFNGALYFAATDGTHAGNHGTELWKSDGTDAGTVLVADIRSDINSSQPTDLQVVGNSLYFVAYDDSTNPGLWRLDAGSTTPVEIATDYSYYQGFNGFSYAGLAPSSTIPSYYGAAGDFNGDGIDDMAWRNTSTGYVATWLLNSSTHRTLVHPSDATSDWEALAPGDYNGDGIDDMAWRNSSTGYVSVWLMDSNGHRHFVHSGDASSDWEALAPGDFNGDGIDDIAWRNTSTGYVSVWLMDSNGNRHVVHSGDATSAWQALSAGDYNGDGIDDIAWRNTATGYVSLWLMDKNGHRHVVHPSNATSDWQALAPGDYNGDGIDDIAWRNTATGYVSVWLMDKNGHRHAVHSGDASSDWQALGSGDYNGDGIDDMAWRNTATGYVSVWLMDKNGKRHFVHSGDATADWQALSPGDYNGDGITDIAWRNTATGFVSVWQMDSNAHRHVVHPSDATNIWQAV